MKIGNEISKLYRNEDGDLYFQKMILIAISFFVGALILTALFAVFDTAFNDRLTEIIEDILTW